MSEHDDIPDLPQVDEPPRSGEWVDPEGFFESVTDEEVAEGDRMGREIDVDDDESGSADE